VSFAAAATFLVLLATLHFIKPEFDPSWNMISQYEIGRYGWVIAAINVTDPITTPKDKMTARGNLHGLGFILGVPSQTIAAVLISLSLRRNAAWSSARRALLWTAQLPWVSLVAMVVTIMVFLPLNGGKFGPGVPVGLPNRLYIIACCVWLMTVAWNAIQLGKQKS
jgi:hypothetical protein